MQRSSLLRIILFIICAMMLLVIAFIAVVFSIIGQDMYIDYKEDELLPKAKQIAQQVTNLVRSNADKHTVQQMIYLSQPPDSDTATYLVDKDGTITTSDSEADAACENVVRACASKVMDGKTFSSTHTTVGVVVGVPIYGRDGSVYGAVVLVQQADLIREKVNSMALTFGIIMLSAILLTLIPTIVIFRSVTKPIRKVSDTALQMANGDLSVRAEVRGSYETQHLAESFNVLAGALQSNIEYLIIERNRLGAILNGIGEGIIAVDKSGEITHFNSSSIRLLGGNEGDQPSSLEEYRSIGELIAACLEADTSKESTISVGERLLSISITPIHEDNDSIYGAVALLRDVTENERLEQTRRDYVANVSHELRTPIASIRSLADALNDELITDPADRKRYYGYILRESMRLSSLIDDLLELSRLQSGGVAFSKMRVELFEILYDVADRMNETAQQRGRSVELLVAEDEYYAFTNSDRVEQVLIALTDNAIKHGTESCRVEIGLGLSDDGQSFLLSVSNPAQIDPADLDHIFERFYKADRAHSSEGTGLGLAIVSEVLNLLDEKISVNYKDGVIRFVFTVARDKRDGAHAALLGQHPCTGEAAALPSTFEEERTNGDV